MNHPRPTDQELSGMTVNERLFSCGLLEKWDAAVDKKQRVEMIAVLRQAALSEEDAGKITNTVLKNPAKYGF